MKQYFIRNATIEYYVDLAQKCNEKTNEKRKSKAHKRKGTIKIMKDV